MTEHAPSAGLSLVAELQLPAAASLSLALQALARSACRQAPALRAAFVLGEGHGGFVYACDGDMSDAPTLLAAARRVIRGETLPEAVALRLDGQTIGALVLQGRSGADAPAGDDALGDLMLAVSALLESRLSEVRLRALEDRVRSASAAGSDWLWETDAEGVLTWVSESVAAHTGWPPSREIGVHSMNLNRPPPGAAERESWDRYRADRAERRPFRDAIAERDTAQGTMLVAISGRPVLGPDGSFRGYRGAARDVTTEVAQLTQARQAQQSLLKALEAVRAGIMISGPDGRVRLSNASWQRGVAGFMTSANPTWESLVRAMAHSGAYPDAVGREQEFISWRLSLASPEATPHELRFMDRKVLVSDQRLPDGSTVHLWVDVSERDRAEQELRATEERLAAVLRAVPDLWFVVDRDDNFLLCSDEHHPLLIVPFETQRGQPFGAALPPPFDARAREALARARQSAQVQRLEYEATTLDGRQRSFEARVAPMPDGQILYLTRDLTELRRMERELLVLQRAIEADAAMPIVVTDATLPDQPIVFVNAAFERLTGYPRAEVLGRNCRFLQGDDRRQPALDALRAAMARDEPCTLVLVNRRRDGSTFLNELNVVPIRNEQGRTVQHFGLLHDVTERLRAAERLRISEELYRSVAATISDGLIVAGPDGRIVACNPSACEMLACEPARLTGKRLSELGYRLHDEGDVALSEADHPVRQVLRGGPPVRDRPILLHHPDGMVRTVLLTARALRHAGDAPGISCLVSFRDVTEQRAAARALADAEERWKFALEGSGDGVWDFDEDRNRAYFSTRWKEMLGHADHEVGETLSEWFDRIHPDDRKAVFKAISDYRRGATAGYQTEHRLRHRDGHWIWMLDRGKIVERHADGRPRRVVGVHTDITRLKQAEQALLDKHAVELASRAKSEFLSRMSHEMRTPLNAVIGFTQLLRMQPDGGPAKVVEYADHVLRAGEHLLGLVNEVLDLQRVEEGRTELQLQALELAPFIDSTLELLRPTALAQGIALSSQVPSGRWVRADTRCLRQVLMNMVSNAVKYNRSGGWVAVSLLASPPGRCVIAIEDTGSGLTDDQLARLFQPFERLGHETSAIEGTGLGLVITRSLIEQMGGTVTLSSVPGAGTLARIDLPASDAPAAAPPAVAAPQVGRVAAAGDAPPLRVLYVEDNRINALLFEEAMRLLGGVELQVAEDGTEALSLVQSWTPEVLVLDANLPDMNGRDLLARLRRHPELAQTPAFMCSADAMAEDLQRAREAGFQDYWTKPIEMAKVSSALDALRPPPSAG